MHRWNKHGWSLSNRDLNCPGPVIQEFFSFFLSFFFFLGIFFNSECHCCSVSHIWLLETPWTAACQGSLSFTIFQNLFKLMFVESMMPFNHLILCCPLLLLPSVFPSIRVFSNESALHIRWPKYWSFNFSISPSNEYSWLISFRIDWFNLLEVEGTLKSLL